MADFTIELLDAAAAEKLTDSIVSVYRDAFSSPPWEKPASGVDRFANVVFPKHLGREGFALTVAHNLDGKVVGFCYGFIGHHGQYWTDYVAERIHPSLEKAWLGGHFEIAELAVDHADRSHGIGRSLLTVLLDSRGEDRMALQTLAQPSPALSLYESLGFSPFGEFDDFVILGKRRS
ncbi:MAG: hypothetical protein QOF79_1038 [Actinomycetota bacterium]|jgi:ribosomal protein S18 acetylase RimI-like enzyme|nr:hypothetical protein [Actinomycetota bacterium]